MIGTFAFDQVEKLYEMPFMQKQRVVARSKTRELFYDYFFLQFSASPVTIFQLKKPNEAKKNRRKRKFFDLFFISLACHVHLLQEAVAIQLR